MKRLIALLVAMLLFSLPLLSAVRGDTDNKILVKAPLGYEYEPYEPNEFPEWSMELRRAETVFFGSFVITFPLSTLAFSLSAANIPSFNPSEGEQVLYSLGAAATLSLIITGIDWLLGFTED